MKVSHSVLHRVKLIFSRTEPNIVAGDKLSSWYQPRLSQVLKKMLSFTLLYTPTVYQKIYVSIIFYFNILVFVVMADVIPLCIDT